MLYANAMFTEKAYLMLRRALALIVVIIAVFNAASAAPRAVEPVVLLVPVNTVDITDNTITFQWQQTMAAYYKFKLKSTDGAQIFSVTLDNYCPSDVCSFYFDPAVQGWTWREGATYKWSVKAADIMGVIVAASPNFSFTADMLPNIDLIYPVSGITETDDGLVDIGWSIDTRTKDSRIVVTNKFGQKVAVTDWLLPANYCGGSACTYILDLSPLPDRKYTWWVEMRGNNVSKIRSAKRTIKLDIVE